MQHREPLRGDEALAIKADTEDGRTHTRISAVRLRRLVLRIGGTYDRWLVVQRVPDIPDVFAQVWHEEGGDYQLEHRLADEKFVTTRLTDPDRVADLLTGWARQTPGWDEGLDWKPVDLGPREDIPELPDGVREKVEERVRTRLVCGYDDRRMLTEIAEDYLVTGDERPVSNAQARHLVDRLWLERVTEQQAWEGPTDPERLTDAFEALQASGITAREDFACCRNCGLTEIGAERADARGFVFFHTQCTEGAAAGQGLMLLYGGFDGAEETTTAVGHGVVAALTAAGLSARWDGNPATGIHVIPLDWRKRLVG